MNSDHILSRAKVGRWACPLGHLGAWRSLFKDIRFEKQMNTSMTTQIATRPMAAGAVYRRGRGTGRGRVQAARHRYKNDLIKEYLSRGTYILGPPCPGRSR